MKGENLTCETLENKTESTAKAPPNKHVLRNAIMGQNRPLRWFSDYSITGYYIAIAWILMTSRYMLPVSSGTLWQCPVAAARARHMLPVILCLQFDEAANGQAVGR